MEDAISSEEDASEELKQFELDIEDDEVDINIHFHCEHCFKLSKCTERSKPGWCCDITDCRNGCGMRFHMCKKEEHELLCSHEKVRCINYGNGCPYFMLRHNLNEHLAICPASVVVCYAEWNRWAFGARERERISHCKGITSNYSPDDIDMCFAIEDQRLVNEMHELSKHLRRVLCNDMNKRFPSLPIAIKGTILESEQNSNKNLTRSSSVTDDEEEGLAPGLSMSVCTELLRRKTNSDWPGQRNGDIDFSQSEQHLSNGFSEPTQSDDISALCCSHGIIKDLCLFCRNDPDEPPFKYGYVWREVVDSTEPGVLKWTRLPRIEKIRKKNAFGRYTYKRFDESDEEDLIENGDQDSMLFNSSNEKIKLRGKGLRFRSPSPTPLTPQGLTLEMGLKFYSKHQVKPKSVFTFQCLEMLRRDEYPNHYLNVHSELQHGMDGWVMQRCPLHILGCPFSVTKMFPKRRNSKTPGEVVYSKSLRAFGVKTDLSSTCQGDVSARSSRSPSLEKNQFKCLSSILNGIPEHSTVDVEPQFLTNGLHITYLPYEIIQGIASYLDGYSLNNLSQTSHFMRSVCYSLLQEKGLVIQEWTKSVQNGKVSWRTARNKWFFSTSFELVDDWAFKGDATMCAHLSVCPFYVRCVSKKFCYTLLKKEELPKAKKTNKNN